MVKVHRRKRLYAIDGSSLLSRPKIYFAKCMRRVSRIATMATVCPSIELETICGPIVYVRIIIRREESTFLVS